MKPGNEAELAELVAGAAGPLRIMGGGTRDVGRPVDGTALSTAGLTGATLYVRRSKCPNGTRAPQA